MRFILWCWNWVKSQRQCHTPSSSKSNYAFLFLEAPASFSSSLKAGRGVCNSIQTTPCRAKRTNRPKLHKFWTRVSLKPGSSLTNWVEENKAFVSAIRNPLWVWSPHQCTNASTRPTTLYAARSSLLALISSRSGVLLTMYMKYHYINGSEKESEWNEYLADRVTEVKCA